MGERHTHTHTRESEREGEGERGSEVGALFIHQFYLRGQVSQGKLTGRKRREGAHAYLSPAVFV